MQTPIFPHRYCLTTRSRTDRQEQARSEFDRVGLDVEFFYGHEGENRHKAFNRSQLDMLRTAADRRENLMTFEDDVIFMQPIELLQTAIDQLPSNWDILYLGANVKDEHPVRYSENLVRFRKGWCTHGICYNGTTLNSIIALFESNFDVVYDEFLSRNLDKWNAYVIAPMLCYQRASYSDLTGYMQDYTGIFRDVDRRLELL